MAGALQLIALYAVLNPATFLVGLYMGAKANQAQKIPIAALIAAIAGMALVGLIEGFGMDESKSRSTTFCRIFILV